MDKKLLIELLEGFSSPQNDNGLTRKILLERFINATRTDLEEFINELSQLLSKFPEEYLSHIQAFLSYLYNDFPRVNTRFNKWLPSFVSKLINNVMLQNLQHSDFHSFGLTLYYCIELLWHARNDKFDSNLILKRVFHEILSVDGLLEIFISGAPGHRCFKRVLFDFHLIDQIERDKFFSAINAVATLVENCHEHKEVSPQLSEGLSICHACTALLKTVRIHHNSESTTKKDIMPPTLQNMVALENKEYRMKRGSERQKAATSNSSNSNKNSVSLSTQDEQYLALLGMKFPQKLSHLPNFLQELEQRKMNTFQVITSKYILHTQYIHTTCIQTNIMNSFRI